MNPSLLGAAAATVLVALWLFGRRQARPFLRSADTSAVAALNRAQISRLRDDLPPGVPGSAPSAPAPQAQSQQPAPAIQLPLPTRADRRGCQQVLRRLEAASTGSLAERIEALALARRWGHPATLPLLRRGLRDVHPAVVHEAALGLEAYRGRPVAVAPASARPSASLRSPRTVARTR